MTLGHDWELKGETPVIRDLKDMILKFAPTEETVLITGETGAGKDVVANEIHRRSGREGSLHARNCAAFSENLIESELFGHVKGAFTGADTDRPGAFIAAQNGTLFLDEIGELKLEIQAKLLRVLDNGQVRPVGSNELQPTNARVIAATNRDLHSGVAEGTFREDLFYRLQEIEIHIPPLRDRLEDIPILVDAFLARIGDAGGRRFSPDALGLLMKYNWPGNVRQFQNVVNRLATSCNEAEFGAEHIMGQCMAIREYLARTQQEKGHFSEEEALFVAEQMFAAYGDGSIVGLGPVDRRRAVGRAVKGVYKDTSHLAAEGTRDVYRRLWRAFRHHGTAVRTFLQKLVETGEERTRVRLISEDLLPASENSLMPPALEELMEAVELVPKMASFPPTDGSAPRHPHAGVERRLVWLIEQCGCVEFPAPPGFLQEEVLNVLEERYADSRTWIRKNAADYDDSDNRADPSGDGVLPYSRYFNYFWKSLAGSLLRAGKDVGDHYADIQDLFADKQLQKRIVLVVENADSLMQQLRALLGEPPDATDLRTIRSSILQWLVRIRSLGCAVIVAGIIEQKAWAKHTFQIGSRHPPDVLGKPLNDNWKTWSASVISRENAGQLEGLDEVIRLSQGHPQSLLSGIHELAAAGPEAAKEAIEREHADTAERIHSSLPKDLQDFLNASGWEQPGYDVEIVKFLRNAGILRREGEGFQPAVPAWAEIWSQDL